MPDAITNELLNEVRKQVQADLAEVKAAQADHGRQFRRVREDINFLRCDIHGMNSDDLRREKMQEKLDVRLERIENRLNLNDPQH
jgi:septal ring factor EnvC (AmiA/AmiB activator)